MKVSQVIEFQRNIGKDLRWASQSEVKATDFVEFQINLGRDVH